MIKKIFAFILIATLVSCGSDAPAPTEPEESESLEQNFTINGDITGGSNINFYLEAIAKEGVINVAEVKADGSGKFKMEGNIPGFGMYQLRLGDSQESIIPLTLVPNDNVTIETSVQEFTVSPKLSGTRWSQVMTDYMQIYSDFHLAQVELMANKGEKSNEQLTNEFKLLKAPVDSFAIAQMNHDPGNPFNIVLSETAKPMMGFNDWDPSNIEVLNKVCDAYNKEYPNSAMTTGLSAQAYQIETSYKQHLVNTSGRMAAPEIALNNPDGVELKLSSLKGKYVLIDFWASWCGPCRRENPNVVRLYNKYKSKGFTIYSVSLDDNLAAWKAAIAADGLVWPNHVSDLLKWNSTLPQLYGFSGIPHTVLLNKEGNVIGVGLRGESLEQKLNEIFTN